MRSLARSTWILLVLLTAGGGVARALAAASPTPVQSVDERAYARLAHGLADGLRYRHPDLDGPVHWPPGAPALFAVAARVDPEPRRARQDDVRGAYVLQAALATALIPAVFLLALLVAGRAAGLVAAAATALYPPLVTSAGDLLSEPLGALLLVGGLIAVLLALRRPSPWRFALAGVVLGATVLTRADLLLVPLLLAAGVAVHEARRPTPRRGLLAGGAVLGGCLLLTGPWSWYASRQAHALTPVSSGGASNLFVGTYLPGDGRMFGLKRELADETRRLHPELRTVSTARLPQPRVVDVVAARRPDLDRDAALRAEALANLRRYAVGEPVAFAEMMVAKVGRLWLGPTVGSTQSRRGWVVVVHLGLLLGAAAGLVAGLWRRRSAALLLLAVPPAYVTLLNAVLVSEARHNLAVMPVLFAAGAAGWALVLGPRAPAGAAQPSTKWLRSRR